MEIETKITVDRLDEKSVSIKTERFLNGERIGLPHRKAYVNSEQGREELTNEVAEPYLSSVLAVWGEEPTLEEKRGE